ncbi:MAG: tryptophan--tRNA ligase [Clostridiales bacterium]|jgi:tryptophanyl-tRNA synthetase|nr:tryptophan--tRNA ligase [Clostridiales bacterium]
MERKKTIFSGIQPSGEITLGNYLGAISNWVKIQNEYNCVYCVVDMHAITVRHDPKRLREQTLDVLALLIACGLDPEKNIIFIQSHVPQHAELTWILNCYTMYGELSRMTQFKDKSAKNPDNINAGLFDYPVLMAADILLYQTDLVPVGEDQKQHLELSRNIAQRFNFLYGDVFTLPEPYIPKIGGRVMSLTDPDMKMSKSDPNPNSKILLLDEPEAIMRKFRRAVTDSEAVVAYREGKSGINNLMAIYSAATSKDYKTIEAEFSGRGYGDFKTATGESVVELLSPVRTKFNELIKNKDYLTRVYTDNAGRAAALADRTLEKVRKKVGFVKKENKNA